MVTVASRLFSSIAAGMPTMLDRPTTTARFPATSIPTRSRSCMQPSGVHGVNDGLLPCKNIAAASSGRLHGPAQVTNRSAPLTLHASPHAWKRRMAHSSARGREAQVDVLKSPRSVPTAPAAQRTQNVTP